MSEDRIREEPATCPTCGAAVRVVSADEGTSSYQPVAEADCAALLALLREVLLWDTTHGRSAEQVASDWANLFDRLIAALPNHTPHPGQPLLERLERLATACRAVAEAESDLCRRCEGNGRLWADGKAHYPSYGGPTVACSECGGAGRIPVDWEALQERCRAALKGGGPDG